VPGRARFEEALDDLEAAWDGGPLSEPARRELAGHLDVVVRWLSELDRLAYRLGETEADPVLTHGEPHPGNLIRTDTGLALVDWDTVAVAPAERDLWMFVDSGETALSAYRDLTGITPDREGLAAYRLLWALSDLAAFTAQLRGEHRRDADADKALAALHSILSGREPAPYGPR
jgi:spectinomycin phosphotransferase